MCVRSRSNRRGALIQQGLTPSRACGVAASEGRFPAKRGPVQRWGACEEHQVQSHPPPSLRVGPPRTIPDVLVPFSRASHDWVLNSAERYKTEALPERYQMSWSRHAEPIKTGSSTPQSFTRPSPSPSGAGSPGPDKQSPTRPGPQLRRALQDRAPEQRQHLDPDKQRPSSPPPPLCRAVRGRALPPERGSVYTVHLIR